MAHLGLVGVHAPEARPGMLDVCFIDATAERLGPGVDELDVVHQLLKHTEWWIPRET